jgi:hypothetical protein
MRALLCPPDYCAGLCRVVDVVVSHFTFAFPLPLAPTCSPHTVVHLAPHGGAPIDARRAQHNAQPTHIAPRHQGESRRALSRACPTHILLVPRRGLSVFAEPWCRACCVAFLPERKATQLSTTAPCASPASFAILDCVGLCRALMCLPVCGFSHFTFAFESSPHLLAPHGGAPIDA